RLFGGAPFIRVPMCAAVGAELYFLHYRPIGRAADGRVRTDEVQEGDRLELIVVYSRIFIGLHCVRCLGQLFRSAPDFPSRLDSAHWWCVDYRVRAVSAWDSEPEVLKNGASVPVPQ